MARSIRALSLSLVLAFGAAKALAATGDMTLDINDSQRVGLYGTVASVVVGNPMVADVAMLDSHSLVISGKGFGATRIQVYDSNGRELFNHRVTIVAPQTNQVTLYRGATANQFDCEPKCQMISGTNLSAPAAAAGAASPSSPLASALAPSTP